MLLYYMENRDEENKPKHVQTGTLHLPTLQLVESMDMEPTDRES